MWRIFAIVARRSTSRTLDTHALLDFSGVLERAVELLRQMDEFSQSRFRLEARYQHVLVDEFQDTSRAQWELVAQLVRSWGEGFGASARTRSRRRSSSSAIASSRSTASATPKSRVLDEAARFIAGLRPDGEPAAGDFGQLPRGARAAGVRQRLCSRTSTRTTDARAAGRVPIRATTIDFRSTTTSADDRRLDAAAVTIAAPQPTVEATAERVADEIAPAAVDEAVVRDRAHRRRARRSRRPTSASCSARATATASSRTALERRGVSTYVYKGLGFFDADEVQDAVALLRYLADPHVEPAGRRVPALAHRPAVRSRRSPCWRRRCARRARPVTRRRSRSNARRRGPRRARTRSRRRAALAAMVDRVTPADLLDASCCAKRRTRYEMRGPRARRHART